MKLLLQEMRAGVSGQKINFEHPQQAGQVPLTANVLDSGEIKDNVNVLKRLHQSREGGLTNISKPRINNGFGRYGIGGS